MARPAALAIVPDGKGRILTVNRPAPPYEMSIPGGSVDPGESVQRAALRELFEETNVVGDAARLVWVASSPTDGRPCTVSRDALARYPLPARGRERRVDDASADGRAGGHLR